MLALAQPLFLSSFPCQKTWQRIQQRVVRLGLPHALEMEQLHPTIETYERALLPAAMVCGLLLVSYSDQVRTGETTKLSPQIRN